MGGDAALDASGDMAIIHDGCVSGHERPAQGTACSFVGRCSTRLLSWTDGLCGSEGYECAADQVVHFDDVHTCTSLDPGPDPGSLCTNKSARAETVEVEGSTPDGDAATITLGCAEAIGWGDCGYGTATIELLTSGGDVVGSVHLTFDDVGSTPADRGCRFSPADVDAPAVDCTFVGQVDWEGEACVTEGPLPHLCGALAIDAGGYAFDAPLALSVWDIGICI